MRQLVTVDYEFNLASEIATVEQQFVGIFTGDDVEKQASVVWADMISKASWESTLNYVHPKTVKFTITEFKDERASVPKEDNNVS